MVVVKKIHWRGSRVYPRFNSSRPWNSGRGVSSRYFSKSTEKTHYSGKDKRLAKKCETISVTFPNGEAYVFKGYLKGFVISSDFTGVTQHFESCGPSVMVQVEVS